MAALGLTRRSRSKRISVDRKSCGIGPGKLLAPLESRFNQGLPQFTIRMYSDHCFGNLINLIRIDEKSCVAGYFGDAGYVGSYNRRSARHGFQKRKSETFPECHINKRVRPGVKSR